MNWQSYIVVQDKIDLKNTLHIVNAVYIAFRFVQYYGTKKGNENEQSVSWNWDNRTLYNTYDCSDWIKWVSKLHTTYGDTIYKVS